MAATFDPFQWFRNFNIAPVTDWQRFINPQFNVTINEGDAALENHVLSRAGSYGKQLGRMQEVLDVLLQHATPAALSAGERESIDKYKKTRAKVVDAVEERSSRDIEEWLDKLRDLRNSDRPRFDEYTRRLDEFLGRRET